ncbi:MAG: helix-turn-helix transcriptional regulator [Phycisphaerae bacterium]|nr:helix-turn-helix transcriptional regulator [Phycisphaerae bacterium]
MLHISQTIKQARLRQKMTIEQVAAKADLSKGFISRLENFRVTPSLNALNKVASAVGLGMADLFQPNVVSPQVLFGSMSEGEEITRDQSERHGMKYFSLAHGKLDRTMSPFLIEYHTCKKQRGLMMHPTDEFFLLLEGKVEFHVFDMANPRGLEPGDTAYLSKNIPHTVQLSQGQTYAKALVVYREEGEE